jgi:hypothetical protein
MPCVPIPVFTGLKLMTLAGYNPNKGPEAFTLLASECGAARATHLPQ